MVTYTVAVVADGETHSFFYHFNVAISQAIKRYLNDLNISANYISPCP